MEVGKWENRRGRLIQCFAAVNAMVLMRAAHASTPASWVSAVSGNWTNTSDWSTNPAYPNNGATTYAAQIAAAGSSYEVTLNSNVAVDSLTVDSPTAELLVNGGTLQVGGDLNVEAGTLDVNGFSPVSEISGATLTQTAGATIFVGGTLDGVTLGSNVSMTAFDNVITTTIQQGLNLNSNNLNVVAGNNFYSSDSSGFTGSGTITVSGLANSAGYTSSFIGSASPMTIGAGITIQTGALPFDGSDGIYIGTGPSGGAGTTLLEGTILSKTSGVPVTIGGNWTNTGTISVSNGGILNLNGSFSTAQIGNIVNSGGTVQFSGNWNNTGSTYTLTPTMGTLFTPGTITAGLITGGTIASSGGTSITLPADGSLNLSGLNLAAPVNLGLDSGLTIENTVILENDVLTFAGGSGENFRGSSLNVTGTTLGGTGTLIFNGTVQPSFITAYNSSLSSTIGAGITLETGTGGAVIVAGNGGMDFGGTIISGSGVRAITMSNNIDFNGSVTVLANGTFTAPIITNYSGGVLSGATYIVNSSATLRLPGVSVVTDSAAITLNGPNSNIFSSPTVNTDALAGMTSISTLGSFTVSGGRSYSLAGNLSDQGLITVGGSSLLGVAGGLSIGGGGELTGGGTINAAVVNVGFIDPGAPTGAMTIAGGLIQNPGGEIELQLDSAVSFSSLVLEGPTQLGGTLAVTGGPGFVPLQGESFALFNFEGAVTGTFGSIELPALPSPLIWDTSELYTNGTISVVPEPVCLAMIVIPALGGLLGRRGRRPNRSLW